MIFGNYKHSANLVDAKEFSFVRQPVFLLILMAFAMPMAFSVWTALLNNFVIEMAGFTGVEIGWLHSIREIPGLLAVGVIFVLLFVREQLLALLSLILLGIASGLTAFFPQFGGIIILTFLASIGFHYFEAANQSLQLQWIDKKVAPQTLGWISAVGSFSSLVAYGTLVVTWKAFNLSFGFVYVTSGAITVLIAVLCLLFYPRFETPRVQINKVIIRKKYWLYYALQVMSGARRQIFLVFAAFMMVEKFSFQVHEVTILFLLNFIVSMLFAPIVGKAINLFGERWILIVEYVGLTIIFLAYAGIYYFDWTVTVGIILFIANHLFFSMSFAIKTYFQKIAEPYDIGSSVAVAFTINHIPAVFLPAVLGYIWIVEPSGIFVMAALMALLSLILAFFVPRNPEPGAETILNIRKRNRE
ncbi:MAG: MFS transporter [Paracoccaceae bacterium]|nr:MFS transporter [Paracoccaceae bacterium]